MVLVHVVQQLLDLKIGYGVCIDLAFKDFHLLRGVLPRMKMNPEQMPL